MHMLYSKHLEKAGWQVLNASGGLEAIDIAKKELPTAVVMDLMMNDLDGFSAIRELRKMPGTQNIPAIIITSNGQIHDAIRKEAVQTGASSVLTKPFSPRQLLDELSKFTQGN